METVTDQPDDIRDVADGLGWTSEDVVIYEHRDEDRCVVDVSFDLTAGEGAERERRTRRP
jgi:hypothetical protein